MFFAPAYLGWRFTATNGLQPGGSEYIRHKVSSQKCHCTAYAFSIGFSTYSLSPTLIAVLCTGSIFISFIILCVLKIGVFLRRTILSSSFIHLHAIGIQHASSFYQAGHEIKIQVIILILKLFQLCHQ